MAAERLPQSCNGGTQHRRKWVLQLPANGGTPCPTLTESRYCNSNKCPPEPCQVSHYGVVAKKTRAGVQSHTRYIQHKPAFGGTACPELSERRYCNTKPCPVDCVVSQEQLVVVLGALGVGTREKTRVIHTPAAHNGTACPTQLSLNKPCNAGDCVGTVHPDCVDTTNAVTDADSDAAGGGRQHFRGHGTCGYRDTDQ